ncbi:site-specific integrase [Pseudomonas sp. BN102]|uniref:site-specific integrase n=1 Tax=Pseudomonas sp. BN102 TaxID=2567886 RepID=UPI00245602CA|nr:site-specific integrase [Pseudomonas sp. BN102]MDH4610425.1 site-specific integrase [Pseudomonas sp. BN102]
MTYVIRTFISNDGERFSQLYDEAARGFPLYYPTAYIARTVRRDRTHETQKVYLEAIKRVCEWESTDRIDLVARFQSHQFLRPAEMDNLDRHLGAARNGRKGEVIGRSKHNTYMRYAAEYLCWLAGEVITESNLPHVKEAIEAQQHALLLRTARKSGSKSAMRQRIAATRLPENARHALRRLFEAPFIGVNREADKGPRLRNAVMLRILYETGMRRGELLSLKLGSFEESGGGEGAFLKIKRNHHDEFDTRLRQPVAKTLGRIVPISDELEAQLVEYRDNWRAEIPGIGFSKNDFLFVNHRAGHSQGSPTTDTAFHSALQQLKRHLKEIEPVHPHLLRHDWNYRFSEMVDAEGWDFEKERSVRESLMGWRPGSDMSLLYNQRHIQEMANEIGKRIAEDTKRKRNHE